MIKVLVFPMIMIVVMIGAELLFTRYHSTTAKKNDRKLFYTIWGIVFIIYIYVIFFKHG